MQWLSENWLFLLIAVGMVAMHLFGTLAGLVYVPIYNTLERRIGT